MRSLCLSLQHPLAIVHPAEIPFIDFPPNTMLRSLISSNSFSLLSCPPVPSNLCRTISIPHRICFSHLIISFFLTSSSHFRWRAHLHAVITDAAVGAAGRSVEMARRTPLHPHLDALHVHVLVQRRPELVILVFILACWGTMCEIAQMKLT